MRHAALTGLLLVSIAACAPRPERRLQELYDSVTAQLWRGELSDASQGASEGLALAGAGESWVWRFTLLKAEIRLVSRELADAAVLLSESPPSGAGDWITAKHRYLQGQLAFLRGKPAEASAILDEASRLAVGASAADVRLDIGAMQGQALIAQRKWEEAEATLNETIDMAQKRGDRYHEAVALLNLGTVSLFRNRFDHALQVFERILAYKDLESRLVYSVALANAGICYQRLGEVDRAIDAQTKAVASHERPGRPRVYYERALGELGTTYLVKGDTTKAIETLRGAMRVAQDANLAADASRWASHLALAHIRLGEWEQAARLNDESRRLGGGSDLAGYNASYGAEIALGRGRSGGGRPALSRDTRPREGPSVAAVVCVRRTRTACCCGEEAEGSGTSFRGYSRRSSSRRGRNCSRPIIASRSSRDC